MVRWSCRYGGGVNAETPLGVCGMGFIHLSQNWTCPRSLFEQEHRIRLVAHGRLPGVRSVCLLLDACAAWGGRATTRQLCSRTGLSKSSVNRGLKALVSTGLIQPRGRAFGRPAAIALTARGVRAARHARGLLAFLRLTDEDTLPIESSSGHFDKESSAMQRTVDYAAEAEGIEAATVRRRHPKASSRW